MINKRRSVSASRWLMKHFKDDYVYAAQIKGLRSRSWFKLDTINRLDMIFNVGMRVVDLGSAPGGWSLYTKERIGKRGFIVACDLLPMRKIFGVNFLQGDCSDPNFLRILYTLIGAEKVHVVLSDMSPNITGISIIDMSRSIFLGYSALKICSNVLMIGGTFLVKVFQGNGLDKYLYDLNTLFSTVKIRKPPASRSSSRELYIIAKKSRI